MLGMTTAGEEERQRAKMASHLLQDWTDRTELERDKALLQREGARLRFDRAMLWGMARRQYREKFGYWPTVAKPMAPLLILLGETYLSLQQSGSSEKPASEEFLQKLFDETEAVTRKTLRGWNATAAKYKQIRSCVEAADKAAEGKCSRPSKSRRSDSEGGGA